MSKKNGDNSQDNKLKDFFNETLEMMVSLKTMVKNLQGHLDNKAVLEELTDQVEFISEETGLLGLDDVSHLSRSILDLLMALKEETIEFSDETIEILAPAVEILGQMVQKHANGEEVNLDVEEIISGIDFLLDERDDLMLEFNQSQDIDTSDPDHQEELEISRKDFEFFKKATRQHLVSIDEALGILGLVADLDALEYLTRGIQGIKGASAFIGHQEMLARADALEAELLEMEEDSLNNFMESSLGEDIKQFLTGINDFISGYIPPTETEEQGEEIEEEEPIVEDEADDFPEITDMMEVTDLTDQMEELEAEEEAEPVETQENEPAKPARAVQKAPARKKAATGDTGKASKEVLKVDINKVDRLMNCIEEMMTLNTKILTFKRIVSQDEELSDYGKSLNGLSVFFEKLTEQLYNQMIGVRMKPVRSVFSKYKNVIMTLAAEQQKKIEVKISGESTEIDRVILDSLKDPMIHLIRNAVDHGVESPDKRVEKGKSPTGHINLRAFNDVNSVVIEIEDDGKGLDHNKIRQKIVEKGLLGEDESQMLSKKEILDYIFKPGFSTAEKVTGLSGRGVGMDVVKTNAQKYGGNVYIQSRIGKGTCIIIRLPLAMSMVDTLIVRGGEELFAIPTDGIERILKIPYRDLKTVYKKEVLALNGATIPYKRLTEMFGIFDAPEEESENALIAIIKSAGNRLALGLDEILGKQKVVIKNVGNYLKNIQGISGAYIQGDGKIILVVDISSLFLTAAA